MGIIVLGITGGICSGKSTVATMLKKMGIPVLDADEVAHRIYLPGSRAYHEIVRRFGKSVLDPDGRIDRKKLGKIVFSDRTSREFLERVTHPAIEDEMRNFVASCEREGHGLCAIEAALIFEKGKSELFDKVITVYVNEETQLERIKRRDEVTEEEALKKIRAQMPLSEKAKLADYVIDNSGSLEETELQVKALVTDLTSGDDRYRRP